jgi:hypothetical protein
MVVDNEAAQPLSPNTTTEPGFYRFHAPHLHLQSVFGDDWFDGMDGSPVGDDAN